MMHIFTSTYPAIHNAIVTSITIIITNSSLLIGPIDCSLLLATSGASGVSFISGGKILYNTIGVAARDRTAGIQEAFNQVTHLLGTFTPNPSANFTHNKFCAAAVRNRALELLEHCKITSQKKFTLVKLAIM